MITQENQHVSGLKLLDSGKLHSVFYVHDQNIKCLNGNVRLKAGISSLLTPRGYSSQTIRNEGRGKQFIIWDDNYLHQNLTFIQAAEIVTLTDNVFKQLMTGNGYNARDLYQDRSIGTEYYEAEDFDTLIEVIRSTHAKAYKTAYEYVTRTELEGSIWIEEFKPRPGQDTLVIDPTIKYFETYNKGTWEIPGGSGKSKMSLVVSQMVAKALNQPWKVLAFSDNIANTVQFASEYSNFYKGQTGKRNMNVYIIGSVSQLDYRTLEAWATVIPTANDEKLRDAITKCYENDQDCAIFVVNKSANSFLNTSKACGVNFKQFFTIMDEIQQYASESDQPKMVTSSQCAVVNPANDSLFGKKLGVTATRICRGHERSPLACYNDDQDKFGKNIVRIDEIKARKIGWICEKECMIIPVPVQPELLESLEQKRPLQLTLGNQIHNIHVPQYTAIEALRKYILPQNKSHILIMSAFIKDVETIAVLLRQMQTLGMVDSEYEIIEGYAKNGASTVNRFNKANKAIMIATRWVGVGQDTYKCDCVFPLYNPGNEWFTRQTSMRGDRKYGEGKVSLLAFVEMQHKLEDNIWYRACTNIANGMIPNIISEAEFTGDTGSTVIGSRLNPRDGSSVQASNVTLIRPRNYDPIMFAQWEDLTNAIATRTFIDSKGNSRFSEIAKERVKEITLDSFLEFSF